MTRMILAATAGLLALSACGERTEPQPVAEEATANAMDDLAAMDEGLRNGVFIRAIRDAGRECQGVESSTSGGDYQGAPVWQARCVGGEQWVIVIGEAGMAQVLTPGEAQAAGVPTGDLNVDAGVPASNNQ